MAGSSNPLNISEKTQDLEFLYASNANVSNFVSVKLSSDRNYHIWKTQMLCLMKTHNMGGIVDDAYVSPRASRKEIMDQYDSLLKGWIFGSASENVLGTVIDLDSAKDVWNKLKSFYDASMSSEQDQTSFSEALPSLLSLLNCTSSLSLVIEWLINRAGFEDVQDFIQYPRDMTKDSGDSSKKEISTTSTPQFQCPMLKPSNYSLWAIRMQIILEANGLWEMIEPDDKTQADNKKDKTAIAFLYQALPEEQLLQITKHKTAKAI
ncbi:ankyrin repeat-containing domain-containing LTR copia-type protein [Tanacetum coccineum]